MKRLSVYFAAVLTIATMALVSPMVMRPAQAQITIELGGDFGRAKQALFNQGYRQIRLVGQGFTKFQVEACLRGVRYWFKSDSRGRINQRRQIGQCQSIVDITRAEQILAQQGYSRINIEDRGGAYIAVACYRNDRVRIRVSYQGQLGNRRVLGSCRESLSPADVSVALQREGYTRIKFINRRLPVYVAEACLGMRKYRLELNEFAQTLSQQRIGDCRGPIDPRRLVRFLEDQGYTKVLVIDDRLPRYVAEVCKGRERIELTLNRYGDVIDRLNTGTCATRIDRKQIIAKLRAQGGTRINVVRENNRGFVIEACLEGERVRFELNAYGELLQEKVLGQCKRYSIRQVKKQLSNRNFDRLQFYVEGCKNGKLIRFKVNEFGDRSERKVLGRCR